MKERKSAETIQLKSKKPWLDFIEGEWHKYDKGIWFGEIQNKKPKGRGVLVGVSGKIIAGTINATKLIIEHLSETERKMFFNKAKEYNLKLKQIRATVSLPQ